MAQALVDLVDARTTSGPTPTNWWAKIRKLWWFYTQRPLSVADSALIHAFWRWDRLPASARERLSAVSPQSLRHAALAALKSESPTERVNIALAAQDLVAPALASVIVTLLQDRNGRVATAAERALTTIANAHAVEYGNRQFPSLHDRNELLGAIAQTVTAAAEDSKAPFTAAMALLDPATLRSPSPLATWLCDSASDHAQLRAVLRSRSSQISRLRAWQWLRLPHLAAACLDRLDDTPIPSDHNPVLERAHLALHPARIRAMQMGKKRPESILPPPPGLAHFSTENFAGICLIASRLMTSHDYTQHLALASLHHADPLSKCRLLSSAAPQQLADLSFDPSESVARGAALRWSAVGIGRMHPSNSRHATLLSRSPHRSLRAIGLQELDRLGAGNSASTAGRLSSWQMLAQDRIEVIRTLSLLIQSHAPEDQMRGLKLIRRLSLQRELSPLIEELAANGIHSGSMDSRVLATTLSLLKHRPAAAGTLLIAADSPDSRVRANAVESLLEISPVATSVAPASESYGKAIERCEDTEPRVRANAIRGLLTASSFEAKPSRIYEPAAVSSLLSMLKDDRSTHRLSGVWTAERVLSGGGQSRIGDAWCELSGSLTHLAQNDEQPHIRRRAAAASRRLAAELRVETSLVTAEGSD